MPLEFLPCKTETCQSISLGIAPRVALAIIDYHSREKRGYQFSFSCDRCNRSTTYARNEVLGHLAPEKRPRPLQPDHFWAYIMIEFKTSLSDTHRTYVGDRVLVQRLSVEPDGSWYGVLRSATPYAPSLKAGDFVKGGRRGTYEICNQVVYGANQLPIPRPAQVTRTSSYAIFVASHREDGGEDLLCANISCSNPSCSVLFGTITLEKFRKIAIPAPVTMPYYGTGERPILTLFCEKCETAQVVDERSFRGLFQGNLSDFKK